MIIYGSRSKQLTKEILTDKCPNCGSQNSTELYIFQKYAHVFWIPFFPMGKTAVSQCDHCKKVLKLKEMPAGYTSSYENFKSQLKTPIWTFTGLVLLVVLISAAVVSDRQKNELNAKLILTPQSGDVFEIKTKESQYTLYKVDNIQGDSVFVRVNEYEASKISGLRSLKEKGDSTYSQELFVYTKSELKMMLEKGEIIDIDKN